MSVTRYWVDRQLAYTEPKMGSGGIVSSDVQQMILASDYDALEAAYLKIKQERDDAQSVTSNEGARVWQDKYRVAQSRVEGIEATLTEAEIRCERFKVLAFSENRKLVEAQQEIGALSEAKLAFYDEQHAVAMETVGRLSDEVQQAQQEARKLARLLKGERMYYLDTPFDPQVNWRNRYRGDAVLILCDAVLAKYGEKA